MNASSSLRRASFTSIRFEPRKGAPLPDEIRQHAEALFGDDLSGVRIHESREATRMGALAFTLGERIFFAPGQYDPRTERGLHLLGHELAHVVQQRKGRAKNPYGYGVAVVRDEALEAEADRMAVELASRISNAARTTPQGRPAPRDAWILQKASSDIVPFGAPPVPAPIARPMLPDLLSFWLMTKEAFILDAMTLRGGWEGWAQVELALLFRQYGYGAEREAQIYQGKRADFVVQWGDRPAVGIELKCQNLTNDRILATSDEDITKIAHFRAPIPVGQLILATGDTIQALATLTSSKTVDLRSPLIAGALTPDRQLGWLMWYFG